MRIRRSGMKCEIHGREKKALKDGSEICLICHNPWYGEIWDTIYKKNKNVLIVAEGESGDGKSYFSMKTGEELDPGFTHINLKERVLFRPKDFLKIIAGVEDKLKKGDALVIEEGGTQADHRKWFSFNNMAINYILQTFRYQNLIVIFNVPVIDYIDSDSRKMFKYHVQALSVDHTNKMNKVKIKRQSYNSTMKKIFRKFLRYKINGRWVRVDQFKTRRPSLKICNEYEKLHKAFKSELARELYDQIMVIEKDEKDKIRKKKLDIDSAVQEVLAARDEFIKDVGGRLIADQSAIENKFKIGRSYSARIKSGVERALRGEI